MRHKIATYWAPAHGQNEVLHNIREMQPPAIVILGQDVQHISDAYVASPNSFIIPRVWEIDDFHGNAVAEMNENPKQAARWHFERLYRMVAMWRGQARERGLPWPEDDQILFGGANEPNQGADYQTINTYAREYGRVAKSYKRRALLARLGVGHPSGLLSNGAVDWTDFEGLDVVIKDGGHFLEVHSYWQGEGPNNGEDYFYLAGRHHWVPWDVQIFVGESGVDGGIYERFPKQGWQGEDIGLSQQEFFDQVIYVHDRIGDRAMGMALFSWDFQDKESWATFDVRPIMDALSIYVREEFEEDDFITVILPTEVDEPEPFEPWWGYVSASKLNIRNGPSPTADHVGDLRFNTPVEVIGEVQDSEGNLWYMIGATQYVFAAWIADHRTEPPKPPVEHIALLDPIFLQAVMNIESGGRTRSDDERMVIRFEAHVFKHLLDNEDAFNKHFQVSDRQPWKSPQYYRAIPIGDWRMIHTGNQNSEYEALEVAKQVDKDIALQSISMGAPQVMGFHYERLGYKSPDHMFRAMDSSDVIQIAVFFNFLFTDRRLVQAIYDNDFVTFARIYNGSDEYALPLMAEYERLTNLTKDSSETDFQLNLPLVSS